MSPDSFLPAPSGAMPNHPDFPVLLYRGVVGGTGETAAQALEALFANNGWPPAWRNGIYAFHHYHTFGHETLGCASGTARVLLGGPDGRVIDIGPGDVAVLPVGTGHCRIGASDDFMVIGAYPPGQRADICREAPDEEMRARIAALPAPSSDPVGSAEGVPRQWRRDRME